MPEAKIIKMFWCRRIIIDALKGLFIKPAGFNINERLRSSPLICSFLSRNHRHFFGFFARPLSKKKKTKKKMKLSSEEKKRAAEQNY